MKPEDKKRGLNGERHIPDDGFPDHVPEIKPISFRSGHPPKRLKSYTGYRWLITGTAGLILVLLCALVWFVFTARQVVIRIDPQPDRISIKGGLIAPRLATYYLLRPGEYYLRAVKKCYHPLDQRFLVAEDKTQEIRLFMEKIPGRFSLVVHGSDKPASELDGARLTIDSQEAGITPITKMEATPGTRHLEIRAENYQDLKTDVVIEGCGKLQWFDFAMVPAWSDVFINASPQNADILIDGRQVGKTPLNTKLHGGTYQLEIRAAGFKTWQGRLDIKPNQPLSLADIRLEPADGTLTLTTKPSGANVTVGETYVGKTPLEIQLSENILHNIIISKAGYEKASQKIKLAAAELKSLNIDLKPKEGIIHLITDPADAELFVDGKGRGPVPQKLKLIATKHRLEIKKKGYKSYVIQITPRPGFPQELKIVLTKISSTESGPPKNIETKNGYPLKLIYPKTFMMGASRREQGRRSNETLRSIQLKRPFYMGVREVTNGEFKEFMPGHKSGMVKGHDLDRDELPVVQVTWEQAAMFCNWLSARESLPPAYVKKGEDLVAANPLGTGYRLPTEAEWEYCARFKNNQASLKYPWGDKFPPPAQAGNYADISAKDLLPVYMKNYNEGYAATAPPEKFRENDLGLYDLGGNVAEWCHDYYSIYSHDNKEYLDPLGPDEGKHHVIRGSSWKHGSISTLRLSYRDYSDNKRPDLGFRVCRYLHLK